MTENINKSLKICRKILVVLISRLILHTIFMNVQLAFKLHTIFVIENMYVVT